MDGSRRGGYAGGWNTGHVHYVNNTYADEIRLCCSAWSRTYNSTPTLGSLVTTAGTLKKGMRRRFEWKNSGGRNPLSLKNHRLDFVLTAKETVTFDLIEEDSPGTGPWYAPNFNVDPFLILLDKNGNIITVDDDGGPGGWRAGGFSRITRELSPGRYSLIAGTYNPGKSGKGRLEINTGYLSPSIKKLEGQWANSQGQRPYSSGNQAYSFTIDKRQKVVATLESKVDTYLYLLNAATKEIVARNDDTDDETGFTRNSRVAKWLPAGTYIAVAATYFSNKQGSFTLKIPHARDVKKLTNWAP